MTRFCSYVGDKDRFEEYTASICGVSWRYISEMLVSAILIGAWRGGGGTIWIITAINTTKLILCFTVQCDGMTLPSLPLDIRVPPAALARRGAICFLRRSENERRRPMQVRNPYCVQCLDIIVARMGSHRESGDTLLITRENLKLS